MVSCRFSRETLRDGIARQAVHLMVQESRKGRAAGRVPVPRYRRFKMKDVDGWKWSEAMKWLGKFHHDLTTTEPWKSWWGFGESSHFMALIQMSELL